MTFGEWWKQRFPDDTLGCIGIGFARAAWLACAAEHAAELARLRSENEALAKFKAYVHKRLDDAGIPTDPPSLHRYAGCRIGGRLDIVLACTTPHPIDELHEDDGYVMAVRWIDGDVLDEVQCEHSLNTTFDATEWTHFYNMPRVQPPQP